MSRFNFDAMTSYSASKLQHTTVSTPTAYQNSYSSQEYHNGTYQYQPQSQNSSQTQAGSTQSYPPQQYQFSKQQHSQSQQQYPPQNQQHPQSHQPDSNRHYTQHDQKYAVSNQNQQHGGGEGYANNYNNDENSSSGQDQKQQRRLKRQARIKRAKRQAPQQDEPKAPVSGQLSYQEYQSQWFQQQQQQRQLAMAIESSQLNPPPGLLGINSTIAPTTFTRTRRNNLGTNANSDQNESQAHTNKNTRHQKSLLGQSITYIPLHKRLEEQITNFFKVEEKNGNTGLFKRKNAVSKSANIVYPQTQPLPLISKQSQTHLFSRFDRLTHDERGKAVCLVLADYIKRLVLQEYAAIAKAYHAAPFLVFAFKTATELFITLYQDWLNNIGQVKFSALLMNSEKDLAFALPHPVNDKHRFEINAMEIKKDQLDCQIADADELIEQLLKVKRLKQAGLNMAVKQLHENDQGKGEQYQNTLGFDSSGTATNYITRGNLNASFDASSGPLFSHDLLSLPTTAQILKANKKIPDDFPVGPLGRKTGSLVKLSPEDFIDSPTEPLLPRRTEQEVVQNLNNDEIKAVYGPMYQHYVNVLNRRKNLQSSSTLNTNLPNDGKSKDNDRNNQAKNQHHPGGNHQQQQSGQFQNQNGAKRNDYHFSNRQGGNNWFAQLDEHNSRNQKQANATNINQNHRDYNDAQNDTADQLFDPNLSIFRGNGNSGGTDDADTYGQPRSLLNNDSDKSSPEQPSFDDLVANPKLLLTGPLSLIDHLMTTLDESNFYLQGCNDVLCELDTGLVALSGARRPLVGIADTLARRVRDDTHSNNKMVNNNNLYNNNTHYQTHHHNNHHTQGYNLPSNYQQPRQPQQQQPPQQQQHRHDDIRDEWTPTTTAPVPPPPTSSTFQRFAGGKNPTQMAPFGGVKPPQQQQQQPQPQPPPTQNQFPGNPQPTNPHQPPTNSHQPPNRHNPNMNGITNHTINFNHNDDRLKPISAISRPPVNQNISANIGNNFDEDGVTQNFSNLNQQRRHEQKQPYQNQMNPNTINFSNHNPHNHNQPQTQYLNQPTEVLSGLPSRGLMTGHHPQPPSGPTSRLTNHGFNTHPSHNNDYQPQHNPSSFNPNGGHGLHPQPQQRQYTTTATPGGRRGGEVTQRLGLGRADSSQKNQPLNNAFTQLLSTAKKGKKK